MAVRISSDASCPKRSASAPTQTAYTLAGWFNFSSVTPARFWGPLGIYAGTDGSPTSGTQVHQFGSIASGSATLGLQFNNGAATIINLAAAKAGLWYFMAMACSSTAAGGLRAYMRAAHERAFTSALSTGTLLAFTPGFFEFGRDGFTGDFIDGSAQHCIAFNRALDEAELMKLSLALLAERPLPDRRNLNVYYRLRGADDITDLSGNARAFTATVGANAQGLRTWSQRKRVLASLATDITGALAQTLGVLISGGAGAVDVAGTLGKTLGALTSVGAGKVDVSGSLAQTLGTLTCGGVGSVGDNIDGTLAKTLGALTSTGAGAVAVDGQGSVTLESLTAAGTGTVAVSGALAKTLGALTSQGVGDNGDVGPPAGNDGYQSIERRRRRA